MGGATSAAPAGSITEFSVGLNAGTSPAAIAAGPDGNLWFTDAGTTKAVGRIATDGTITEFSSGLNAGSVLRVIATGPDGNLWFADAGATPAIGRITPSGVISEFSSGLNAGSSPDGVVAGPDGNVWFTDRGATPAVGRITPGGVITEFSSGLNAGSSAHGITLGPDGNLWFVDPGTTPAIGRSTPSGVITEFSGGLNAGSLPDVIVKGPDGNLWFSDQSKSIGAVGRITTSGTITEFSGLSAGGFSRGIAAGPDGNLWFTDQGTTKAVGKIATDGTITELTSGLNPGSTPFRIAAGPDGNVWFSDTGTTKAIGQLGVGAPAASASVAVTGGGHIGASQTCVDTWNDWAGQQPSRTALGFDGYQWLLDGHAIVGQTAQSYTPAAGDLGHQLSCKATVTYTLFPTTVSASSGAVLVQDATPPVLVLPSSIVVNATGPGGAIVTYAATATDNVDPNPVVSCVRPSGSAFPIGTSTVNCTATDASGNTAPGSFTVRVVGAAGQLVDLANAVQGVGPGKTLAATVAVAQLFLAHGATCATSLTLVVFELEVRAQAGKKIPAAQAAALIADASRIRAVLGC
jgi:virginiamycin B lyase